MAIVSPCRRQSRRFPWRLILLILLVLPIAFVLIAPTIVVIPMSFSASRVLSWPPEGFTLDWYYRLLFRGNWLESAENSLSVAVASTCLALLFGVPAGIAFGLKNFRGKQLALAFVIAPLVIPTIVLGIGMYRIYGWLGLDDFWSLSVAHAVIGVPLVVINTMSAARQINLVLLLAARSLGASPLSVFFHVTLPSVRLGVLSGAVFAFISSWDEVVIAKYLTTPTFRTIPVQMWSQLTERVDPSVAAMSTALLVFTTLLIFSLSAFRKKVR